MEVIVTILIVMVVFAGCFALGFSVLALFCHLSARRSHHQNRFAPWQFRQSIDRVSDEYLNSLEQHLWR